MTTKYVSLGSSCSIAYQLANLGLRKEAYPFDWIRCGTFKNVVDLIETNFTDFYPDPSVGKLVKSDKFKHLPGDDDFLHQENDTDSVSTCTYTVQNTTGTIQFYHDFSGKQDVFSQIDDVVSKYKRRIDRFYDVLNSKTDEIVFIRDELKIAQFSLEQVDRFINLLKSINPDLKYKLIIIVHNPRNKKTVQESMSDRVKIINDIEPFGGWTRPNVDWTNLFI